MILIILPLLPVVILLLMWLWPAPPAPPPPKLRARDWPQRKFKTRVVRRPLYHQSAPCSDIWAGERPQRADPFARWYQENWDRDLIRGDAEEFDFALEQEPGLTLEDQGRVAELRAAMRPKQDRELRVELRAEFYKLAEDQTLRDQGLGVLAALVGVPLSTARGWWARGVARGFLRPYRRTALMRDNDKYGWTPQEARRRFQ